MFRPTCNAINALTSCLLPEKSLFSTTGIHLAEQMTVRNSLGQWSRYSGQKKRLICVVMQFRLREIVTRHPVYTQILLYTREIYNPKFPCSAMAAEV